MLYNLPIWFVNVYLKSKSIQWFYVSENMWILFPMKPLPSLINLNIFYCIYTYTKGLNTSSYSLRGSHLSYRLWTHLVVTHGFSSLYKAFTHQLPHQMCFKSRKYILVYRKVANGEVIVYELHIVKRSILKQWNVAYTNSRNVGQPFEHTWW